MPSERKSPTTLVMNLEKGDVVIETFPEHAPRHVERFLELASEGAYDGVIFHRVIEGFVAQTGDVEFGKQGGRIDRAGSGRSSKPDLAAEISDLAMARGMIAAVRDDELDSANCQFFVNLGDNGFLTGHYTVFARVIDGMEVLDSLEKGEPPTVPDHIVTLRLKGSRD
jgi:peptidylprolyl isomerase